MSEQRLEKNENPLAALLTDPVQNKGYTEKLLVEVLGDYLKIEKDSGEFALQPEFFDLETRKQVAILLCGQLAKKMLGLSDEVGLSQSEVINGLSHIPDGTVKSILNELRKMSFVVSLDKKNQVKQSYLERLKKWLKSSE